MSGYLEEYGVADARRETRRKRWIITIAGALVALAILYFGFRNFREKRLIAEFQERLAQQQYEQAYALWCSADHPCSAYPMERFMTDWGPGSSYAKARTKKVAKVEYCEEGSIITLDLGAGESVPLWVDHSISRITFAPWPVCNPVVRVPRPTR